MSPDLISNNHVPMGDGTANRVLAGKLLPEVRSERALEEMRRLLASERLRARRGRGARAGA